MARKVYESYSLTSKVFNNLEFCPFSLSGGDNSGPKSLIETGLSYFLTENHMKTGLGAKIADAIILEVEKNMVAGGYYIYSIANRNLIFTDNSIYFGQDKMRSLADQIDQFLVSPPCNKLFADKLWLAKFEKDFKNT